MKTLNIDVVIVTYNRLDKLKHALNCYDSQTCTFRNLIVVNNKSTDGTKEYLQEWKEKDASYSKYVLNMDMNLGGSGGFYQGQKFALTLNPDWIFLSDDDAYVEQNLFEKFCQFINSNNNTYSAICGSVCYTDGSYCIDHRSRLDIKKHIEYKRFPCPISEYSKSYFTIDLLSYVGSFINCDALRKVGLVNPEYFIYFDDSEHSLRLKKYGEIICLPSMKIIHDTTNSTPDNKITWQKYYYVRNNIHMIKTHFPLAAFFWTRQQHMKHWRSSEETALVKEAIRDAWHNRLGLHDIYKPGWEIIISNK